MAVEISNSRLLQIQFPVSHENRKFFHTMNPQLVQHQVPLIQRQNDALKDPEPFGVCFVFIDIAISSPLWSHSACSSFWAHIIVQEL